MHRCDMQNNYVSSLSEVFIYILTAKEGSIYIDNEVESEYSVGRIQINHNGGFGYISFTDSWDEDDVEVVCRQLGYSGGDFSLCPTSTCGPTKCAPRIWDISFHCNRNENHLVDCTSTEWKPYDCVNSFNAVGARCASMLIISLT